MCPMTCDDLKWNVLEHEMVLQEQNNKVIILNV